MCEEVREREYDEGGARRRGGNTRIRGQEQRLCNNKVKAICLHA
jgi:hypothetical protein